VYHFLEQRIAAALKDVCGWEHVKKFVVLPYPFTIAAEELTVSLKLRRNVILTHYGDRVEELYRKE
jgi:long-chain acyl-CoA synthetase